MTSNGRRWPFRLSRLDLVQGVLLVLVFVFALSTMLVPSLLSRSHEAVEQTRRHDIAWTGNHAVEELQRLEIALLAFAAGRADADRDEALVAEQVLAARFETWSHGSFGAFVAAVPERHLLVSDLRRTMPRLEAILAHLGEPGAAEKALVLLDSLRVPVEKVAAQAFIFSNQAIERNRDVLADIQTTQNAMLIGLLVCGLVLIALFAFQNRLLHRAYAGQRQVAEHQAYLANHDALTGLANRETFRRHLSGTLGHRVAVLAIDLDGFKPINDTLGHMTGDAVLASVARRLEAMIAFHPENRASRFGGDEFFVLLNDVDEREAERMAGLILRELGRPHEIGGQLLNVNATIGLSLSGSETDPRDHLVRNADLALNRAKLSGKNTIVVYHPSMTDEIDGRRRVEAELVGALKRSEFEPYYQVQVDMASGRIRGVEALARWVHPERGVLSPNAFIAIAESSGQIVDIGQMILEKACRDAVGFPEPISVSVNLSTVQLIRSELPSVVADCLARTGLPAHRLTLEITETVMMRDEARCREMIRRLRDMGVAIALDDFGTGYSSLAYLDGFGFDELKIDRSFVADIARRSRCMAIIQTIVALGRQLGLSVVAEGIETMEQATMLMAAGCSTGQGYLYGRPVSAADIATWFGPEAEQRRKISQAPLSGPRLVAPGPAVASGSIPALGETA